ncbi:MAG: helix-turn-helix transcriptional regulator [Armatimonadetes bacterium]|nr:helix-turn-helix transcriptional regulator [Armatimonadota bacterium]
MSEHGTQHGEHGDPIFCPTNAVLNLLSERWTLHIVRALLDGRRRFNDIARTQGINPRTLRERLRALEEEGVVTRTVVSTLPPHVEYALTPKGEALNGIFEALADWGRMWMKPKGAELVGEETLQPPVLGKTDKLTRAG